MKKSVITAGLLIVVIISLTLGGCKAAKSKTDNNKGGLADSRVTQEDFNEDADGELELSTERKLIKKASLIIESNNYEKTLDEINDAVISYKGFIQSSKQYIDKARSDNDLRHSQYVLRIPTENLDSFIETIKKSSNVLELVIDGKNVTDEYIDVQSRLKTLRIEEERLLEILKKTTKLSDIIELESRLTQVRRQIEEYTTKINKLDSLVELATVEITLSEVENLTPKTKQGFFVQLGNIFFGSLDFLSLVLMTIVKVITALLPFVVVFGGIALIIILIVKRRSRNKNN